MGRQCQPQRDIVFLALSHKSPFVRHIFPRRRSDRGSPLAPAGPASRLTGLTQPGSDDACLQPSSGHARRQSRDVYARLAVAVAQRDYNVLIGTFPLGPPGTGA